MNDAIHTELMETNGWLSTIDDNQKEIIRLLKKIANEPDDGD